MAQMAFFGQELTSWCKAHQLQSVYDRILAKEKAAWLSIWCAYCCQCLPWVERKPETNAMELSICLCATPWFFPCLSHKLKHHALSYHSQAWFYLLGGWVHFSNQSNWTSWPMHHRFLVQSCTFIGWSCSQWCLQKACPNTMQLLICY